MTGGGRLFRKYVLWTMALVCGALLASGAISVYFSYQENKAALSLVQHEKAVAAAARIEQFIRQIESQLSFAALPQLGAAGGEERRIEFLKLIRQVPAVTDIAQIDSSGREQLLASRLAMDVVGSQRDRSDELAFKSARAGQTYFGPVYFRKETEPYMTIAVKGGGETGSVTVADVNLKFIWDVVSRIHIGEKGKAYVVDDTGHLVADPDIGLVLKKTDLSGLDHVKAAFAGGVAESARLAKDVSGNAVLTAFAPIEPLGWRVFVEQPVSEVYATLNASIVRTGLLIVLGLAASVVASLAFARNMVRPIAILQQGAQRIGAGNLEQKIEVRTGDELEALAEQFNNMTGKLRESYSGLEQKVEERTRELTNSLDQQTAISEILRVISNSPTNVQPVLDAVAERAAHLCAAPFARIMLVDGEIMRPAAAHSVGSLRDVAEWAATDPVPLNRTSLSGRAALDRETVHCSDVLSLVEVEFPGAKENMLRVRCRAVLAVPLMREGGAYGAIFLARLEPGLFAPDQVALVQTFARQAAIAIDNVRLFNKTKEALEQQTATAEILRVISGSITDTQPVFDAIVRSCQQLFGGRAVALALPKEGMLKSVAFASDGNDKGEGGFLKAWPLDRGSGAGACILDSRVIAVSDTIEGAKSFPRMPDLALALGYRSALFVPLLREGKAIGCIAILRALSGEFDEKETSLAKTFADQAVIAIENVRLINETKEALKRQTAISEILRVISSSPTDVQAVLDAIAERAAQLCDASAASMYLTDGDTLRHLASKGPSADPVGHVDSLPINRDSISGRALLERRTIEVEDMLGAGAEFPLSAEIARRAGHRTVVVVPLFREGKPFGTILLRRQDVRPFSQQELALLQTFGDQAAIAIENVRLFREIEDKSRQLEVANKHKSEFLANMSHELRTPLNAIIGFSEVLLEKMFGEINAKQQDYLSDIHSSGRHLLALINDILDLSKIEAGRMELDPSDFDVPSALQNALTLVRERAQRHGIALSLNIDPEVHDLRADERKFKQIVVNLLSNAVKFTPDGGSVALRARGIDTGLEVSVSDTGIGIAPEDQEKVFEEFRQVGGDYKTKQEGTGLGLALARKFVQLHGGVISVKSELGKGATFTFTVPWVAA